MRRFLIIGASLAAAGCIRIVELHGDDNDTDAVPVDAPGIDADTSAPCSVPLACLAPDAGKVSLCGWIHDIETDAMIAAASPLRQACAATTADGPCSLRVRFFDALDFAMYPTGAVPSAPQSLTVDDCGRFVAHNLPRAAFGFISIVVDNGAGTADRYVPTAVPYANAVASPVRAYATRRTTDAAWTTSASLGGPSFVERGVLVMAYVFHGVPHAGVQARRNGANIPGDDFYFGDSMSTRNTVDPARTNTGPNGSVLVINSANPIAHDGVGNSPAGCQWPSRLGASPPGVVSVQRFEAETTAGELCP